MTTPTQNPDDPTTGGDAVPVRTPSRSGGSWRTPFAWLALVIVCTVMVASHMMGSGGAPGKPAPATPPEDDQSVMLRVTGQYAIGVKALGSVSPALSSSGAMSQMVGTIEDQSKTPLERLRAVMLGAELSTKAEARDKAAAFAADASNDPDLREDATLIARALDESNTTPRDALTPDERDRLLKRHHWFARVLLAHGLDDSAPERAAILDSGRRTILLVFGAVGLALGALAVGAVLFVIGMILLASGSLRPAYRPAAPLAGASAAHRAALLESLVLFVIALVALSAAGEVVHRVTSFDARPMLLWLALPVALWPRLWGMDKAVWKRAIGCHAGRGLFREIGAGFVGYLAMLPVVAVGLGVTLLLVMLTDSRPSHPVVEQAASGGGWWDSAKIMILACLWAPICEETFFRGAMYAHCRRWMGPVLSALIVAFVFAAIHPQGWAVVPALMGLAVGFALIREWRGSLIASITAHAIQNGFVMGLNLLMLG